MRWRKLYVVKLLLVPRGPINAKGNYCEWLLFIMTVDRVDTLKIFIMFQDVPNTSL